MHATNIILYIDLLYRLRRLIELSAYVSLVITFFATITIINKYKKGILDVTVVTVPTYNVPQSPHLGRGTMGYEILV